MKLSITKRTLFFLLAIVLVISSVACGSNHGGIDSQKRYSYDGEQAAYIIPEEQIRNGHEANIAYNNILNAFLTPDNEYEYHVNYAGAYLNEEGKLVVLVAPFPNQQASAYLGTESNILSGVIRLNSEAFNSRTDEFINAAFELYHLSGRREGVDILFQEARYSYSFLCDKMTRLINTCLSNNMSSDSIWRQVTGFSIFDDKNQISVKVLNINEEKTKRLLFDVDFPGLLYFENTESFAEPNLSMWAGHLVNGASIGYRARRYNSSTGAYQNGFVTAGHVIALNQNAMKGTTKVGVYRASLANANMDAAFVEADSGWTMEVETSYGYKIAPGLQLPAKNTPVYKEGNASGRTNGMVLSNNATSIYPNVTAQNNLVECDYRAGGGDSGGIVYTSSNIVVGVHVSGPTLVGTAGVRYAVAATRIYNGLDGSNTVAPYY